MNGASTLLRLVIIFVSISITGCTEQFMRPTPQTTPPPGPVVVPKPPPIQPPPAPPGIPDSLERKRIQVNVGNIRSEPSTRAEILEQVDRGAEVGIFEKKGKWYRVVLPNGKEGWAHQSLFIPKKDLQLPPPGPEPNPSEQQPETQKTLLLTSDTGSVDVYSDPKVLARKIGALPSGTEVRYLERGADFFYIEHQGMKGYVYKRFVRPVQ